MSPLIKGETRLKNVVVLLLIPLLAMSMLYVAPGLLQAVHAATGEVCIAPHPSTTCPTTTPTILGPTPSAGATFSVDIVVSGSDALSGFDITLLAPNSTVLVPSGAALTSNSVLSGATEIVKCIGTVNKLGSSPCAPTDTPNTIEYAVTGGLSSQPVTGSLFEANFTVFANSFRTPVTFQTGCTSTSVSGGVCVTISNGSKVAVSETAQSAKFTNQAYFDIQPSVGSLRVARGDNSLSQFLTVVGINGFGGLSGSTVNLSTFVSSNESLTPLPLFSVSPTSVSVTSTSNPISGMNITVLANTPPGVYTLNITGTSASVPPNSVTMQLIVPPPDFQISLSPQSISFNVTAKGTATLTIRSFDSFVGNVTLSLSFLPEITARLSNQQATQILQLTKDGTNSTNIIVNSTIAGGYSLNVTGTATGTAGTLVHIFSARVLVVDYEMQVPTQPLVVIQGSSKTESISVPATSFYNTTVTIRTIYVQSVTGSSITGPSNGISVTCTPINMTIVSTGNVVGGNTTNCVVLGRTVGDYIVTVTASSGVGNRTSNHAVSFQVSVVGPNFSVILPSTVTTVPVGGTSTIVATIQGNLGLVSNVTMNTPTISGQGLSPAPTLMLNVTGIIHLNVTSPEAGVQVTITASSTTPPGTYNMTIAASGTHSDPSSVSRYMLVIVVSVASPHNLGVTTVSPSTTSTTVGSKININIQIENLGKLPENATIVAIVGDLTIGTNTTRNLGAGQNYTTTIVWDTSGWSAGSYTVGAKVLAVNGQTNTTYSTLRFATPVVLAAVNTSPFSSAYTIPLIIVAVIIIIVVATLLFLLPRRKPTPAQ
jgi:hypothetical protein